MVNEDNNTITTYKSLNNAESEKGFCYDSTSSSILLYHVLRKQTDNNRPLNIQDDEEVKRYISVVYQYVRVENDEQETKI